MFQAPQIDKNILWRMTYDEFNKWRIENDLPRILKFFQEKLNKFLEWQNIYKLTDEEIIRSGVVDVLKPNKVIYFTTSIDKNEKPHDFMAYKPLKIGEGYGEKPDYYYTVKVCKKFEPYI